MLTGEMETIQSSAKIQLAADNLAKLRNNVAYLGTQGTP